MFKILIKLYSFIIIGLLFCSFGSNQDGVLKISINKLRNNKGNVIICLFKAGVGYPDKPLKAYKRGVSKIKDKLVVFEYKNLPAGDYAIAMLHDENEDNEMTTNVIGLPKEGYGFSNNVMGAFGPPEYSKAKFVLETNGLHAITIKTKY